MPMAKSRENAASNALGPLQLHATGKPLLIDIISPHLQPLAIVTLHEIIFNFHLINEQNLIRILLYYAGAESSSN